MPTPRSGLRCVVCGAGATRNVSNAGYCDKHQAEAWLHRADCTRFLDGQSAAGKGTGRRAVRRELNRRGLTSIPRTHLLLPDSPVGTPSAHELELLKELRELED